MRTISGFPLGPILWLSTTLILIGGMFYLVHRLNAVQRSVNRITGLLIANGWDLETGKQVKEDGKG